MVQWILRLQNWLRLESYKKMFHTLREKTGSLSATEAFSADVIHLLGRPTLGQFAATLGISQPNATYKVNSLVAKGYVEKLPSTEDRREIRIQPAEKLRRYLERGEGFFGQAEEQLAKTYTQDELALTARVLDTLLDELEKEEKQ